MNLATFVLLGLGSASLLFIQQSDPHTSEPTDKPNIFFLPEKENSYRAKISLLNPFEDKILGYKISTNQPDRVKITNSKTMSHGYILPKQQRPISMKYTGSTITDTTSIKLEWVVLDPKSLNPDNTDPEALKSLFLTFGRVSTLFKCKETAIKIPEIIRVPTPHGGSLSAFTSLTDILAVFILLFAANLLVSLVQNVFYH